MDHFQSWTPRFHQAPTTPSPAKFTESPHIQINIYIRIITHSVYNTLAHRAKVVSTTQQTLYMELEHIKKALQACHFPPWTLNKLQHKSECKHNINNGPSSRDNQPNNNSGTNNSNINKNISIVVPYIQGLGKRFKRTCNNKGIQVHFKGTNTIKSYSWNLKTGQQTSKEWSNLQI